MLSGTTKVTVEMTTRRPTLADVQEALDILRAEGVPDEFEVSIIQSEDREYVQDVPYAERPVSLLFRMEAERASRTATQARVQLGVDARP